MPKRKCSQGFTLLEILVVLVIVAIITAVAVISFGDFGRGRRQKLIAEQFARTISMIQQQAIIVPSVLGLLITDHGYHVLQCRVIENAECKRWRPLKNDPYSNRKAFYRHFKVSVSSAQSISLSENQSYDKPWIVFVPSGYVTPFVLSLISNHQIFKIIVRNNGQVLLTQGTKQS